MISFVLPALTSRARIRVRTNRFPPFRRSLLFVGCWLYAAVATAAAAELPTVALFTTGGTIQSKGTHRLTLSEYNAGRVTPDELLTDLPELKTLAKLEVTEISNIGSGGMTT
jgi:L-asparaginase